MLTARHALLSFLSAAPAGTATVRLLVRVGAVLGLPGNAVRVAISRLKQTGALVSPRRGVYRLGSDAEALRLEVHGWRSLAERTRRWTGGWLAVHTASLSGTGRRRARALRLAGFREVVRGLQLRPDNLAEPLDSTRHRLRRLGLDAEAPVFRATGLPATLSERALAQWDGGQLRAGYRALHAELDAVEARLDGLSLSAAARQAFEIGDRVIRALAADPLLPRAVVETVERDLLADAMRRFDRRGKALWAELLQGEPAVERAGEGAG